MTNKNQKKTIKKEVNYIRPVPPLDKHYPMTGKDLVEIIVYAILGSILFTIIVKIIFS